MQNLQFHCADVKFLSSEVPKANPFCPQTKYRENVSDKADTINIEFRTLHDSISANDLFCSTSVLLRYRAHIFEHLQGATLDRYRFPDFASH